MAVSREEKLLEAGARLAAKHGTKNVTRRMVAKAAKLPESVVSYYMGASDDAQKRYAKRAKVLGLTLPDKATEAALGVKLRAHGPRATSKRKAFESAAPVRKRSIAEVKAIKGWAEPSVVLKRAAGGKVIGTVKTRKSGGDARDVAIPGVKAKRAPQTVTEQAKVGNATLPGIAAKSSGPTSSDTTGSAKRAARKPAPAQDKALPGGSENKTAARLPMAPPPLVATP
jgi:hypothetical protein